MDKWPKRLRHRGKLLATIYRPKPNGYPLYRVVYQVEGKRRMKSFATYSGEDGARQWADKLVSDLAKHSKARALSEDDARDALDALDRLQRLYEATGKEYTLYSAVNELCDAVGKLTGRSVNEAVDGFLTTVATVKRKDLAEAVTEFVKSRKHLSESKDGKRPKLSPVYAYNVSMWLDEFAATFPGHAVSDLSKDLLNTYVDKFKELSAKSRNDRRAVVKMFLRWCVAQDFLSPHHRLFEAVGFKTEEADIREIEFYHPTELRSMLERASKPPSPPEPNQKPEADYQEILPVIALGGLAGLRREEIMRLNWSDVWRIRGKIEIGASIAKGRKRRLVSICNSLAAWLRPHRHATGPVWSKSPDSLEEALTKLRNDLKISSRRNGLRHSFITFHMARFSNENLTAAEAGNSPQMIHEHYRALATAKEATKWFAVAPKRGPKVIHLTERIAG